MFLEQLGRGCREYLFPVGLVWSCRIKDKISCRYERGVWVGQLCLSLLDEHPAYVDMPVWYTHNITNIGDDTSASEGTPNDF